MKSACFSSCLLLVTCASASTAGPPTEPHAEALGVMVARLPTLPMGKPAHLETGWSDASFIRGEGMMLRLAVYLPGQFPVDVDVEASRILSLIDDKGTKLPVARAWGGDGPDLSFNLAPRDEAVLVRLRTTKAPTRGASEVHLRAELAILCGDEMRKDETKTVVLKKDSQLDAGTLSIRVTKAEKHSGDLPFPFPDIDKKPKKAEPETAVAIRLSSEQYNRIRSIEWLDAGGKVIPSRKDGYSVGLDVGLSYVLTGEVREARLRVIWYGATKKVRAPVDLKVGLGL